MSVLNQLNEQVYHQLHQTLLHQPTRREKQLHTMMHDPIKTPLVLQPKIWNSDIIYPNYIFDTGLTKDLPKEFYQWWKTYYGFHGSPFEHVKVQIVPHTNRTLETFFIHKKPPRDILTKMETS